ncbi:diguanylate cyclase with GAF sensor [Petrotoga mobilis SJ95]|uniref:Diguanylate cyclase with GAF sensor n=1 Tax=Petrotoga mobilis (strain DSM 10674 / SJ95) TaxID=403833 RepID=A9BIX8_PETMO|nr:sensor domain-containing diguanylate cyclase [Petrotoga mobilis]ABX32466.1 diguanylate cyclase with GAF sensor [Petrotoga mobilis SJ95]
MNVKIKSLILLGITIFSFYFLRVDFESIALLDALMVIALTAISDNIRVYWNYSNRLVSNTVGFVYAFILGPQYILISSLVILLSKTKHQEISRKLYRTLVFSTSYSLAALISYRFSPPLSIFLFLTISKIINTIIVEGRKNFDFSVFIYEYLYFLSLLPFSYLYLQFGFSPFKYLIISVNLLILMLFYLIIKTRNDKNDEILRTQRIRKLNDVIVNLSKVIRQLSLKVSSEKILDQIAEIMQKNMGYAYVLISLFNYQNNKVERIAHRGLKEEMFEKIKGQEVPISEVLKFMDEKYNYKDTYFIPHADKISETYTYQPRDEVSIDYLEDNQNLWDPDDLLLLALRDERNNIIGYISLDSPENNLRPSKEELNILSVFAQLVSLALEHSQKFMEIRDQAERDSLTGLFNHSKLFSDLEDFEKNEEKICAVFIDLDDFKDINDKYGHKFGDDVLVKFSQLILNTVRNKDRVYRYGGDEFVILFTGISTEIGIKIIERLYDVLKVFQPKISFSAGLSTCDEVINNYKEIVEIADRKMYLSKNQGKGNLMV